MAALVFSFFLTSVPLSHVYGADGDIDAIPGMTSQQRLAFIDRLPQAAVAADAAVPVLFRLMTGTIAPDDFYVREKAKNELTRIGAPAIPFLLDQLRSTGDPDRLAQVLGQTSPPPVAHMLALLNGSDTILQQRALAVLGYSKAEAQEAIPVVARFVEDTRVPLQIRTQALDTLGNIGVDAPSMASFIAQLLASDKDDNIRERAAVKLASSQTGARRELATLIAALSDSSALVRVATCKALSILRGDGWTALPHLQARARGDTDSAVRHQAWQAILSIDPISGMESLIEALKDPDDNFRIIFLNAVTYNSNGALRIGNPRLTSAILDLTKATNPQLRERALSTTQHLVPSRQKAEALITGLSDPVAQVRAMAASGMASGGVAHDRMVSALLTALHDQTADVRSQAVRALGSVGTGDPSTGTVIVEMIRHDQADSVRLAAIESLSTVMQIQGAEDAMIGVLLDILRAPSEAETIRIAAAQGLSGIPAAKARRVPVMAGLARDHVKLSHGMLVTVLNALNGAGDIQPGLAALVERFMSDHDPNVVVAAMNILRSVPDDEFRPFTPRLIEATREGNPSVRATALDILTAKANAIGTDALIQLTSATSGSDSPAVRQKALSVLMQRETTVPIIETLLRMFSDPDRNIQSSLTNEFHNWVNRKQPTPTGLAEAITPLLADPSVSVRSAAAIVFAMTGTFNERAQTLLTDLVASRKPTLSALAVTAAATAAANGNDAALDPITMGLKSEDSSIRNAAVQVFGANQPAFERFFQISVAPSVISNSLKSLDAQDAKATGHELRRARVHARALENQIKVMLQSRNPEIRRLMLRGLVMHKADPVPAIAELLTLAGDDDPAVRQDVLELIRTQKIMDPRLETVVLRAMADPLPSIRVRAIQLIATADRIAGEGIDALERLLSDPSPVIGRAALNAIEQLALPLHGIENALAGLWNRDTSTATRAAIIRVLARIGENTDIVARIFTEGLASADAALRAEAAARMGGVGELSGKALPRLREALRDESPIVRASAAQTLGRMERAVGTAALSELKALLTDASPSVRAAGIGAIANLTEDPAAATAFLLPYLRARDAQSRRTALIALAPYAANISNPEATLLPLIANPGSGEWLPAMLVAIDAGVDKARLREQAEQAVRYGTATARAEALLALTRLGYVRPTLIDELADQSVRALPSQRRNALNGLELIAASAFRSEETSLLMPLEQALSKVRRSEAETIRSAGDADVLGALVEGLRHSDWRHAIVEQIKAQIDSNFSVFMIASLYILMLLTCFLLSLVYPPSYIWLGRGGRALRDLRIRFGNDGREVCIPLRKLMGLGFFEWSDRAARAWTKRYYQSLHLHRPHREWLVVLDRWPFHRQSESP